MSNTQKFIFSGFGGQGLMFLGKLISSAAVQENKFVTWFPSYGAEVRGGTAHCAVVISDEAISSPFVSEPTVVLAMNQPSVDKFESKLAKDGIIFVNETLVHTKPKRKDIKVFNAPFTEIASKLGEIRIANMVALGSIIEITKILSFENIYKVLDGMVPKSRKYIMETNKKAVEEGRKLIK